MTLTTDGIFTKLMLILVGTVLKLQSQMKMVIVLPVVPVDNNRLEIAGKNSLT